MPLESGDESDDVKAVSEFRVLASPAMLPMLGNKLGRLLGKFASIIYDAVLCELQV